MNLSSTQKKYILEELLYVFMKKKGIVEDVADFVFEKQMRVTAVVDEETFLSSPTIYYSYCSLDSFLSNYPLNNLSEYYEQNITWKDCVTLAGSNEQLSSYSHMVFLNDYSNYDAINILKNTLGSNYAVENVSLTKNEAFDKLLSGISYGLWVFIAIAFFGTILIVGIVSFSSSSVSFQWISPVPDYSNT